MSAIKTHDTTELLRATAAAIADRQDEYLRARQAWEKATTDDEREAWKLAMERAQLRRMYAALAIETIWRDLGYNPTDMVLQTYRTAQDLRHGRTLIELAKAS